MSALRAPRGRGQGPRRAPDRPRRARRAVAAVPVRQRRHPLARAAGQRAADRRLQPVPPAAGRLPAERPDVRLRGRGPHRRPGPRRARGRPRRVDDRGARRHRHGRRRRHPLPPRPAPPARGRQARRGALPRRLRRRRRQRRAVHAGRLHALRRGADPVPARRRGRCRRRGRTSARRRPRIRPTTPLDALAAVAGSTPRRRRSRSRASRRSGWPTGSARARTGGSRAPASTPILRFADVEGFVQGRRTAAATARELDAFIQIGVAKEDQPHYLRVVARPDADVAELIDFGLGVIGAADRHGRRPPPRARRHRARADLRIADRPATGGGRLRRRSPPSPC